MTAYRSAGDLARAHRERAARVYRSIETATKEGAEIARQEAIRLSSGSISSAELRDAGHPFARKRVHGRFGRMGQKFGGVAFARTFPLLPINIQTGRLVRAWRVFNVRPGVWRVLNSSPEARYVLAPGGTRYMVSRQFWQELDRRVVPRMRKRRETLLRAATGG